MEIFDEITLRTSTKRLSDWQCVAFMAYCCERMLPNYQSFFAQTSYGKINVLRAALDYIWTWVESSQLPIDVASLTAACEQEAPDTSEFSSIYTSAALDAATAIAITLDALEKPLENQLVDVASLARDSVDLYVQERANLDPNDPLLEEKILKSDLMQAELRAQRESILMLESLSETRDLAARHLRERWSNLRKGSLDPT
ncbi:DUF416 family protein [Pseudoxanthomonas sacheonensis]|uniref:DUF416 family protein n=1 Tax=Pseudoxanthomonas sacheonensis TaxID=443615 RepID=UPI0013D83D94|nr:DUF416 family protein [Pseudoxanthomonas sacheonensis]